MPFFLWLYIFLFYLKTLAPTVVLHDSGELITSAYTLGITHPPGYPLYCILGKLVTLLPIGNIAFRMNLFSAISASLASLVLYFIILKLFKETSIFLGIISALCFAYTRTVWLQAVICEKYTLNALFLSLLLYILILWSRSARLSYIYLFSFVLGLGFSHHLQTVFIIPAFLFLLATSIFKDKIKFHPLHILFSILIFLIPLTLYIYLPIRSSAYPALCWNMPNTPTRFIYHITASEYRQYFSWDNILSTLGLHLGFFIKEFNILALLIPIGLFYSFFKQRRLSFVFLLITTTDLLHCLRYKIHNISDYYIPTYFISSIWIAYGVYFISYLFKKYKEFIMICFLSLTFICYIKNLHFTNYKDHYFAYDYAKNVLRWQDRGSLCFVKGDTLMFPIWYIHYVEDYRDDIILIDILSLRHSWYITWLNKYHGFALKNKEEENLYKRFDEILSLYKDRSVYLAYDETISKKYKLIPAGILHKIKKINTEELDEFDPVYRYIHNTYIYRDKRTTHNIKNYAIAHNNRGKYYQEMSLYKEAEKEYKSSLLIDPNNSFTYYQLGMLHRERKDYKKALFYFNMATRVEPEKAYGYYGCALIYYDQGLYKKAEALYKRAIEKDREAYFLYEELAILYMQEGRYKEAVEYFKRALEKNPTSEVAKRQLLLLQPGFDR